MENRCELIKDVLPLYVEDLCSDYTKNIVDEHNLGCADCRQLLDALMDENGTSGNTYDMVKEMNPFKKVKRRNMLVIAISVICTVVVVSIICVNAFVIGAAAPTSAININHIEIIDEMTFSIELSPSTDGLHGLGAKEVNRCTLIKSDSAGNVYVKANLVLSSPHHVDDAYKTTLGFDKGGLGSDSIKAIYLVGKDKNDVKLIWEPK